MADLQEFKDSLSMAACGMTAQEAWAKGVCVSCKEPALAKCYSDDGRAEYRISGMCEACFDECCKEPVVCGDMFWNADDPERSHETPDRILENCEPASVKEFQQATRLPNFFGFYLETPNETETDCERQFHYFETEEEARAALEQLTKRGGKA